MPGPRPARGRGRDQTARTGRGACRSNRRDARDARGLRPLPARPRPGQGEPAHPRLRRVARKEDVMGLVTDVAREQTRARYPDQEGYVERNGIRVFWECYGDREQTILLPPTWEIVHSRCWKMQIPFLARHARVVTFDPRGNGRSDRPTEYADYMRAEFAEDALAVLDAAGVDRAVVVGWCDMGESLILAAEHPDRVAGLVLIAPPVSPLEVEKAQYSFDDVLDTDEGWAKENRHYWLRDWEGYLGHFFSRCFTEPQSTKAIEDCVGWGLETDAETILTGFRGWDTKELDPETTRALCARLRCPVLVVQGTADALVEPQRALDLAAELAAPTVLLDGSGHAPQVRDPVKLNLMLREFAGLTPEPKRWTRGRSRKRRALFVCSPIGLGHAQRDVAIARELRQLVPDLEIDWLAQHPVTALHEG